jgi:1-pyrroline-5-carboxylate dehydrogenase
MLATSRSARRRPAAAGGNAVETAEGGYYIQPTVFADVAPTARIAQEEIFGPVLAVIKVGQLRRGAGHRQQHGVWPDRRGLFQRDREKLDRARTSSTSAIFIFNRKCTGAMVGAHPFGGFNMSGTDSKAGGPDYLLLFTQAKSVAERLTK